MENNLKDMQSEYDTRGLDIQKVGISDLKYPIKIKTKKGDFVSSIATIEAAVSLPKTQKGTHMSRFIATIKKEEFFGYDGVKNILVNLKNVLNAENAYFTMEYTYFIERLSPISNIDSLLDVKVKVLSSIDENNNISYVLNINFPVTSLCPCSKEISNYGAHNQRAYINVKLDLKEKIYIEDIIDKLSTCGSSIIYSLLKRPDEKYVTEKAYENPMFVEDIVRDVALKLNEIKMINNYEIRVDSMESIHNHQAFAYIIKK